jgi:hypothetical protein
MPLSAHQFAVFQDSIVRLSKRSEFFASGIRFAAEDIVQVVSHDHDILQCLDIILGAMNFHLNDKHKDKPSGARTAAKLSVYQHISKRIHKLHPNFNTGVTTDDEGDRANRWNHRYRHWNFARKERDALQESNEGNGNPIAATLKKGFPSRSLSLHGVQGLLFQV